MRKLRLDLDALEVDSFRASPDGAGAGGTVLGRWDVDAAHANEKVISEPKQLSDGDTWCFDNGCTGDEPCTASTWTEQWVCNTDRGCVSNLC